MPTSDQQRSELLRRVGVLAGLDRVALARVAAHLEPISVPTGGIVCAEGDPEEGLYIVLSGSFGVFAGSGGGERRLRTLSSGDHFGEIALLTGGTRSATVRAESDGELFRLDRTSFLRLLDEHQAAGRAVATTLARRLRDRDRVAGGATTPEPAIGATPLMTTAPRPGRARKIVGVVAAIALAAAAVAAPEINARFVLVLAAAIALWITEPVPTFVTALGLMAAWVVANLAEPWQVLQGFASMSWVFVLSVLGIALAISRLGLLLRVGILLIVLMPHRLFAKSLAFLLSGILLTPMLPLAMGRAAITSPLALAVSDALGLRDRSPESATLGMSAWIGSGPLLFLFLNGSPVCLLAWALLGGSARDQFNWIYWFLAAAPLALFIVVGTLVMLFLLNRPGGEPQPVRERLELQLAVLGPLSRGERVLLGVIAFTVAGWAIGPIFKVDPGVIALIGFIVAAIASRFDARTVAELEWGYLLFYGVVLALIPLFKSYGLDRALAEALGPRLLDVGLSGPPFVLAVAVVAALARAVLLPEGVVLLLSLVLIPVAGTVGVSGWLVVIPILAMCVLWYLPQQSPEYLVAHNSSEGRLYSHDQARRTAIAYIGVVLAGLALSLPYWRLLGLL